MNENNNENDKVIEVFQRVKKVIVNVLNVSEESIKFESNYSEDFGADSLDRMTLIMELEDEFKKTIAEEEIKELETVAQTDDYITKLIT